MTTTTPSRALALAACALALAGLPACGATDDAVAEQTTSQVAAEDALQLVPPTEAASIAEQDGVQILDVRTREEFDAGHLAEAEQLDFYAPDFADRLAELDRDTTWVVYCRSGNRSGQATTIMADLGFTSVVDLDGGIVAWQAAGLPVTTG
jgi:rhodanese-related sulfurtransferase